MTDPLLFAKQEEEKTIVDLKKLMGSTDACVWAEEFVKLVKVKPSIATDEGTMIGWFANAIMTGYDCGEKEGKKHGRT